jgi:hypothetical protein
MEVSKTKRKHGDGNRRHRLLAFWLRSKHKKILLLMYIAVLCVWNCSLRLLVCSALIGGNVIASGISSFLPIETESSNARCE